MMNIDEGERTLAYDLHARDGVVSVPRLLHHRLRARQPAPPLVLRDCRAGELLL